MTDLRTAAQQALEALKDFACHGSAEGLWDVVYDLRAALEQPEHKVTLKPVFYAPRKLSNEEVMAVIGPFRREQPEQDVPEKDCGNMEPVAWWNPQYGTDSYAFSDEKSDEWRVPLYAHPPRREWQVLSNGELYTAYITATNQTLRPQDERLAFAFARAIEAKLKEKNV